MIKRFVVVCLALACAACGDAAVMQPTATVHAEVPLVTAAPVPTSAPVPQLVVDGPAGCLERRDLPPEMLKTGILVWTVTGLSVGFNLSEKGYHFDDTVNCESTEQQQRTQNSHLRTIRLSPTSARVEYDLDANDCKGRVQPDFFGFGLIIKQSDEKVCRPSSPLPAPPAPPNPEPPKPVPPKPVPPKPTPPPPVPPKPVPPKPAPPRTPDCPKQHEHHCEKTPHRDCHREACRRERCHDQKGVH